MKTIPAASRGSGAGAGTAAPAKLPSTAMLSHCAPANCVPWPVLAKGEPTLADRKSTNPITWSIDSISAAETA
jgi:hypothetical protein